MATATYTGPVDFAVFSLPEGADLHEGLARLLQQVALGSIELLDVEVLRVGADGTADHLAPEAVDAELEGAGSRILGDDDRQVIVDSLEPGCFALVLVYEDRSLAAVADAFAAVGGAELWSGGIDIEDLEQSLADTGAGEA